MTQGSKVRVYPHGSPGEAVEATVLIISKSQRSIAVAFQDKPSFVNTANGIFVDPAGIVMFATRLKAWGPWAESFHGDHYEIEEVIEAPSES